MQPIKKRWIVSLIVDAVRLATLHRAALESTDARRVWVRGWDADGLPPHQIRLHAGDESFLITVSKIRGTGQYSTQRKGDRDNANSGGRSGAE